MAGHPLVEDVTEGYFLSYISVCSLLPFVIFYVPELTQFYTNLGRT